MRGVPLSFLPLADAESVTWRKVFLRTFAERDLPQFGAAALDEVYFWATPNRAELDLLLLKQGRRAGVEIKCIDALRRTRSMTVALNNLGLDALYVVCTEGAKYAIDDRITAVPGGEPLWVFGAGAL